MFGCFEFKICTSTQKTGLSNRLGWLLPAALNLVGGCDRFSYRLLKLF